MPSAVVIVERQPVFYAVWPRFSVWSVNASGERIDHASIADARAYYPTRKLQLITLNAESRASLRGIVSIIKGRTK